MIGWTRIDNAVIDRLPQIGLAAFAVYVVISKHANAAGVAWPSVPTIARSTGTTVRTVRRAVATLQAKGLIRVERRKDATGRDAPSRYILSPVGESDTKAPLGVLLCQGEGDTNDPGRVTPEHPEQDLIEQEPVNKRRGGCAARFAPPSLEEITAYCRERNNHVDPQHFLDYQEARGWRFKGGQSMKDWRATVRTWERNGFSNGSGETKKSEPLKYRA
jgi:hypothetical protein